MVRCKSFTEAAAECFISQSAISQQLQALEHELGAQLIRMETEVMILSGAGQIGLAITRRMGAGKKSPP